MEFNVFEIFILKLNSLQKCYSFILQYKFNTAVLDYTLQSVDNTVWSAYSTLQTV